MSKSGSAHVILLALMANFGIALAKLAGALISGSASMLAETIHSLVDCLNQVLLLIGQKRSSLPANEQFPLGRGREAFFWSFMVAILLFTLGGVFAIYEGIHKLSEAAEISSPILGLSILGVSLVLEGISFRGCIREIQQTNPFGNLWQWFKRSTSAELIVVFIEDTGAILGLLTATVCLLISWITGNPAWDAYGSILVGSVLVIIAIVLAVEIKALLVGEAPATDLRAGIEPILQHHIPGSQLLKLIALQTGTSEIMLSYKITPGSIRDTDQLIHAINEVEREVRLKFPEIRWQFVEPDHVE
jgi:cation diffusion facilitator family transporter